MSNTSNKIHIQKPTDLNEKNNPAVLRLDSLAQESKGIWTQIKGTHNGLPFSCLVQCEDHYGDGIRSTGIIIDHKQCGIFTSSETIAAAMLYAAGVLRGCIIDWDSLYIKSSRCPLKRKELAAVVKEAWQEAFR